MEKRAISRFVEKSKPGDTLPLRSKGVWEWSGLVPHRGNIRRELSHDGIGFTIVYTAKLRNHTVPSSYRYTKADLAAGTQNRDLQLAKKEVRRAAERK